MTAIQQMMMVASVRPLSAIATPLYNYQNPAPGAGIGIGVSISVGGGTPPYTYNTTHLSGTVLTITGATTRNPGITMTGRNNGFYVSGTMNTRVTDATGAFTDAIWYYEVQWGSPN